MRYLGEINGQKTFFAGCGLLGLALYQASQDDYLAAVQSVMAALAVFGLRHDLGNGHGKNGCRCTCPKSHGQP